MSSSSCGSAKVCGLLLHAWWLIVAFPCAAQSIYAIGNSITNDSLPDGTAALMRNAVDDPSTVSNGMHILAGATIVEIWEQPGEVTKANEEFGPFIQALPNHEWDHVVMQPHYTGVTTLEDDIAAMTGLMELTESNPANDDTIFYVHGYWPQRSDWSWWERPAVDSPSQKTRYSRDYYALLINKLEEERPGRVRLMPTGEVFWEIGERIASGELTEMTSRDQLYRDAIHAGGLGQFVAATTFAATALKQDPTGWGLTPGVPNVPTARRHALQEIIWDVLVETRLTGVSPLGDFNRDTVIDEADRELWAATFGAQSAITADLNGDEVVDNEDFQLLISATDLGRADISGDGVLDDTDWLAWQAAYGSSGPSAADINEDGSVDAADYTIWADAMARVDAYDLNEDGRLTSADHQIVESQLAWSRELLADGNGDGVVDAGDYTIWRDAFDATAGAAIPEPSAGLLASLGLIAAVVRRRVVA